MFRFAASVMPVSLRLLGTAAVVCSALNLVGCGGGSRAKAYAPDRIVVFGDELSALTSASTTGASSPNIKGLAYSVNVLNAVNVLLAGDASAADAAHVYYCPGSDPAHNCLNGEKVSIDANTTFSSTAPASGGYPLGSGYGNAGVTAPGGLAVDNVVTFNFAGTASVGGTSGTNVVQNAYFQYACTSSSNAALTLARAFGLGFRDSANGCPTDYGNGQNYAVASETVSTVQGRIAAHLSELGPGTLVMVWVGQNDVLEIFNSTSWPTMSAKVNEAARRADALAGSINTILATGAKVVLVAVPDISFSPYALAQSSTSGTGACISNARSDGSSLGCNFDIEQILYTFNHVLVYGSYRGEIQVAGQTYSVPRYDGLSSYANSGRQLAFVDAESMTRSFALNTSYVNSQVCTQPSNAPASSTNSVVFKPDGSALTLSDASNLWVQYCTTLSLVSGGSTSTYLWADDSHLAPVLHSNIGVSAYNRASNQF